MSETTTGKLTAQGVVEAFVDRWRASDLADKMPEPQVLPDGNGVELALICVYTQHQGSGYASRALAMLTDVADENGVTIRLTARRYDLRADCRAERTTDELATMFGRHAFMDLSAHGDDTRRMIRKPYIRQR